MWPMILAGAVKAGTQIYSGIKQQEAARENARLVREQAEFQKESLYDQASQLNKQGQAAIGGQRSAFASSGVKIDKGSPLAVLNESRKSIQQDVGRLQQAGGNALKTGMNQAKQIEQQGRDALSSAVLGGATSFITSVANSGFKLGDIGKNKIIDTPNAGTITRNSYETNYTPTNPDFFKPKKPYNRAFRDSYQDIYGSVGSI